MKKYFMKKYWKIGKTYKSRGGEEYTLLAFAPDGRLIVEHPYSGGIYCRGSDGTVLFQSLPHNGDLINDDPTEEELRLVDRIAKADTEEDIVKIIRDIRKAK